MTSSCFRKAPILSYSYTQSMIYIIRSAMLILLDNKGEILVKKIKATPSFRFAFANSHATHKFKRLYLLAIDEQNTFLYLEP